MAREKTPEKVKESKIPAEDEWIKIGIPGLDSLLEKGIPKGTANLIAGGPGSGKTILCLQTLNYGATQGEKCLYMTFEESPERLRKHMHDFGWNPEELEEKGLLVIRQYDPFEITRVVEALLEKAKRELLIEATPMVLPEGFKPDRIAVDSLSAIAAPFVGREESYRIYVEHLFKYFESLGATSFFISETEPDRPRRLTRSGIEEFLADGVILMYNVRKGGIRESAVEILKMRGAKFQKKVVFMEINSGEGIVVYPTQRVFEEIGQ
ncbi:MAG: RAD55 family ATPase [Candidatus Hydrothermarchaeales archaeon]